MAEIERDWVDSYFTHGVDIANRRVFVGDIDEITIDSIVKGLYLMDTASDEPCEMFISSYGGTIYDALALYDIMNTISCPIHTFSYGKCMSCAPLLLAAGEPGQRWAAPHVALMTHDWYAGLEGRGTELVAGVKHNQTLGEKWNRLMAKHTTKDYRFWNGLSSKNADYYFTAEQAIEWGVCDHIWSEK